MKILKIQNGGIKNVIVPGEYANIGWHEFKRCIDSFFNRSLSPEIVQPKRSLDKGKRVDCSVPAEGPAKPAQQLSRRHGKWRWSFIGIN